MTNNSDVINGGIGPAPNWKKITKIKTKITVAIEIVTSELSRLKWIRHDMTMELINMPTFEDAQKYIFRSVVVSVT